MRSVFDITRNESGLVDRYIGTAFDIVKYVHDNLPEIKQVSFYMEDIVNVNAQLATLQLIQDNITKLLIIEANLPFLQDLMTKVGEYMQALQTHKTFLASNDGAGSIGTTTGQTVQTSLNGLQQSLATAHQDIVAMQSAVTNHTQQLATHTEDLAAHSIAITGNTQRIAALETKQADLDRVQGQQQTTITAQGVTVKQNTDGLVAVNKKVDDFITAQNLKNSKAADDLAVLAQRVFALEQKATGA